MTPELGKILGQPVIVKLLPGGSGMKGTEFVANGPADGYTILFTHNYFDQLVPQIQKVPFDPLKDLKAVARINMGTPIFFTHAGTSVKTLKDFVSYAKAHPGTINFGHSGVWSVLYVPALQLVREAGLKVNFIPHKGGGPLLRALLAGQDDVGGLFATQSRPHVKAGKLIALAIVGKERLKDDPDFKDVPTTVELGYPSVTATMDRIVMAPAKTPPERLKILRDAFEKLSKSPAFKAYVEKIGEHVQFMGGEEYDQLRPEKYKVFGDLIKEMTAK
jgi:tripartite-type tricarboxylate transporter receptor subunit TctC